MTNPRSIPAAKLNTEVFKLSLEKLLDSISYANWSTNQNITLSRKAALELYQQIKHIQIF